MVQSEHSTTTKAWSLLLAATARSRSLAPLIMTQLARSGPGSSETLRTESPSRDAACGRGTLAITRLMLNSFAAFRVSSVRSPGPTWRTTSFSGGFVREDLHCLFDRAPL